MDIKTNKKCNNRKAAAGKSSVNKKLSVGMYGSHIFYVNFSVNRGRLAFVFPSLAAVEVCLNYFRHEKFLYCETCKQ